VYEDNQKNFDKEGTVLSTCNQFNPAQYNPDIFQPVELVDEEVSKVLGVGNIFHQSNALTQLNIEFNHVLIYFCCA
jgi:hypothetical protein